MSGHIVTSFDEELDRIDALIVRMGKMASAMISDATQALLRADETLASRVVADDRDMDAAQRELDTLAISLIAKRQPMAQDLRTVVAAIRIAGDLERIGDLAKNIAKRVGAIGSVERNLARSVETMTSLVLDQLSGVIEGHAAHDAEALVALRLDDKLIDVEYTAIFRELLTYMMEDPRNITACTHLLFCAKNLERIGDHATNIAENAYYAMTGRQLPLDRPKHDEMSASTGED